MRRLIGAAVVAIVASLSPAVAASVAEMMAEAGLLGAWAFDCAAKPAPSNPHLEFAPGKAGGDTRHMTFGTGNTEITAAVQLADRLGNDTIHLREAYTAGMGDAV